MLTNSALAERKAELRRQLQAENRRHSPEERAIASRKICDQVRNQPLWQTAAKVLFYMPLQEEPDITLLIHEALASGKVAAFPRFDSENRHYLACAITNTSDLQPGKFGIPEPTQGCPLIPLNELDFLLVPGVGFTLTGRRLGRGKGYYDRLLAEARGRKCGVAFDWQVAVEVPAEPHDVLLDCIVTPTRWHDVAGQRRV